MQTSWKDLSPTTRRWIVVVGGIDAALRAAALVDLVRRPSDDVNGSKPRWAIALAVVNSAGIVPIAYFLRGRRRAPEQGAGDD